MQFAYSIQADHLIPNCPSQKIYTMSCPISPRFASATAATRPASFLTANSATRPASRKPAFPYSWDTISTYAFPGHIVGANFTDAEVSHFSKFSLLLYWGIDLKPAASMLGPVTTPPNHFVFVNSRTWGAPTPFHPHPLGSVARYATHFMLTCAHSDDSS